MSLLIDSSARVLSAPIAFINERLSMQERELIHLFPYIELNTYLITEGGAL
jgi:hypothetical protein